MQVIDKKYFSGELIQRLCTEFLEVENKKQIFVSGNMYAANYLDYYIEAFYKAGADVVVSMFSDKQIYRAILNGDPEEEATVWFPQPLNNKKVWIRNRGEFEFDLMIIMLASPFECQDFSMYFHEAEIKVFTDKFSRFVKAGTRNSWNLTRMGAHKLFLDMPSRWTCKEYNLDFDETMQLYDKALKVSSRELTETGEKIRKFFDGGNEVHITCPLGTDLRFRIQDRNWVIGDVSFTNTAILQLPGGEIFCPPVENEATGCLHLKFRNNHSIFKFDKGVLMDIEWLENPPDNIDSAKSRYGVGEIQLCEFGIGTNKNARVIPTGPIFEKTFGTVHIGCGCNDTFGGNLSGDKHYDLIVKNPYITLDGQPFDFGK